MISRLRASGQIFSMAAIAACTASGSISVVRLFQPPGNRLLSTGASLKPALPLSTEGQNGGWWLEASFGVVDGGIDRRLMLHPFQAEPAFGGRHRVEDALFEFVDRPGQGRDEMRNHGSKPPESAGARL